jgi:hypothetical protein
MDAPQFSIPWPWFLSPVLAGEQPTTAGLIGTVKHGK